MNKLKQLQGKDIWLMGGGELTQSLFDANLIDVMIFNIVPIILVEGIPLFSRLNHKQFFDPVDIQTDSGLAMLSYSKMKEK